MNGRGGPEQADVPAAPARLDGDALGRDLRPRMPARASWEGWFCIAIGRPGAAVRWTKTHLFRSVRRPGRHPVAALEGLRASPGELVTWIGTPGAVRAGRLPLDAAAAAGCAADPFALRVGEALEVSAPDGVESGGPRWRFARRGDLEGGGAASIDLSLLARDRVDWLRVPRLLTYFGVHCVARGTIRLDGAAHDFTGLGVLEHAWGGSLPFDPVRLVRGRWHWDVLHPAPAPGEAEEGGGALAALAALWAPLPLFGRGGVRGAGRLPGGRFGRVAPRSVEYLAREAGVPRRWLGRLRDARTGDDLVYEASASTPAVEAAPGVSFLGFDFELRRGTRRYAGAGFCECGGPWRDE